MDAETAKGKAGDGGRRRRREWYAEEPCEESEPDDDQLKNLEHLVIGYSTQIKLDCQSGGSQV